MKRFVNVRIPVILAVALIAGIIAGCLFVYFNISLFWLTAVIPLTAVIFIVCAVQNKLNLKLLLLTLTAAFIILGLVNCYCRLSEYDKNLILSGESYTVSATVCEKGENSYGEYVILKNASADDVKLNGKVIAYLGKAYGDFCDTGYRVSFTAKIQTKQTFEDGKICYYAQENIKYACNVYGGLTAKYGFSPFGNIRSAIRKTLYDNVDANTAAVAYALLTGNTQGIDEGTVDGFRYGGIAHVFAVSGLHIGIVFGIILLICKKLKLNKYLTAALCLIPVFFYAGVCGFTLSSVRAVIMCTVSVFAKMFAKKYDGLNALSLAVILILSLQPASLFSVGFQLSMCATGGIILLSKNFARTFGRLPRKLTNAVSVSLSAQAATFPVLLSNFGYVSGAGLLMNIVILPVMSAIFVITLISTITATVLSFTASAIMPFAVLPLEAVVSIFISAGFEKSLISGFGTGAFLPIYFIGLIALSDKLNIENFYRICTAVCTASLLCICVLIT